MERDGEGRTRGGKPPSGAPGKPDGGKAPGEKPPDYVVANVGGDSTDGECMEPQSAQAQKPHKLTYVHVNHFDRQKFIQEQDGVVPDKVIRSVLAVVPGLTDKYGPEIINVILAALQFSDITTYRDLAELQPEDLLTVLTSGFRSAGHPTPTKQTAVKILRAVQDEPRVRTICLISQGKMLVQKQSGTVPQGSTTPKGTTSNTDAAELAKESVSTKMQHQALSADAHAQELYFQSPNEFAVLDEVESSNNAGGDTKHSETMLKQQLTADDSQAQPAVDVKQQHDTNDNGARNMQEQHTVPATTAMRGTHGARYEATMQTLLTSLENVNANPQDSSQESEQILSQYKQDVDAVNSAILAGTYEELCSAAEFLKYMINTYPGESVQLTCLMSTLQQAMADRNAPTRMPPQEASVPITTTTAQHGLVGSSSRVVHGDDARIHAMSADVRRQQEDARPDVTLPKGPAPNSDDGESTSKSAQQYSPLPQQLQVPNLLVSPMATPPGEFSQETTLSGGEPLAGYNQTPLPPVQTSPTSRRGSLVQGVGYSSPISGAPKWSAILDAEPNEVLLRARDMPSADALAYLTTYLTMRKGLSAVDAGNIQIATDALRILTQCGEDNTSNSKVASGEDDASETRSGVALLPSEMDTGQEGARLQQHKGGMAASKQMSPTHGVPDRSSDRVLDLHAFENELYKADAMLPQYAVQHMESLKSRYDVIHPDAAVQVQDAVQAYKAQVQQTNAQQQQREPDDAEFDIPDDVSPPTYDSSHALVLSGTAKYNYDPHDVVVNGVTKDAAEFVREQLQYYGVVFNGDLISASYTLLAILVHEPLKVLTKEWCDQVMSKAMKHVRHITGRPLSAPRLAALILSNRRSIKLAPVAKDNYRSETFKQRKRQQVMQQAPTSTPTRTSSDGGASGDDGNGEYYAIHNELARGVYQAKHWQHVQHLVVGKSNDPDYLQSFCKLFRQREDAEDALEEFVRRNKLRPCHERWVSVEANTSAFGCGPSQEPTEKDRQAYMLKLREEQAAMDAGRSPPRRHATTYKSHFHPNPTSTHGDGDLYDHGTGCNDDNSPVLLRPSPSSARELDQAEQQGLVLNKDMLQKFAKHHLSCHPDEWNPMLDSLVAVFDIVTPDAQDLLRQLRSVPAAHGRQQTTSSATARYGDAGDTRYNLDVDLLQRHGMWQPTYSMPDVKTIAAQLRQQLDEGGSASFTPSEDLQRGVHASAHEHMMNSLLHKPMLGGVANPLYSGGLADYEHTESQRQQQVGAFDVMSYSSGLTHTTSHSSRLSLESDASHVPRGRKSTPDQSSLSKAIVDDALRRHAQANRARKPVDKVKLIQSLDKATPEVFSTTGIQMGDIIACRKFVKQVANKPLLAQDQPIIPVMAACLDDDPWLSLADAITLGAGQVDNEVDQAFRDLIRRGVADEYWREHVNGRPMTDTSGIACLVALTSSCVKHADKTRKTQFVDMKPAATKSGTLEQLRKYRDVVPGLLALDVIKMSEALEKLTLLLTPFTRVLLVATNQWATSAKNRRALEDLVQTCITTVNAATDVECMAPQQSAQRQQTLDNTLADLVRKEVKAALPSKPGGNQQPSGRPKGGNADGANKQPLTPPASVQTVSTRYPVSGRRLCIQYIFDDKACNRGSQCKFEHPPGFENMYRYQAREAAPAAGAGAANTTHMYMAQEQAQPQDQHAELMQGGGTFIICALGGLRA